MFCIGKLVKFDVTSCSGKISQISPKREEPVYFQKGNLYQEGTLAQRPRLVKGQPYVAYNLKGNPLMAESVTLLKNVKPESLAFLIYDNALSGKEIDNIIRMYRLEKYKPLKTTAEKKEVVCEKAKSHHSGVKEESVPNEAISKQQLYIDYLSSRGVKYFVHFTPEENIDSIMENGLRPRSEQTIKGTTTDNLRLDLKLDALSLSISFPNYQMFYRKRKEMDTTNFVILRIAIDVLKEFNSDKIAFYSANAASGEAMVGQFADHCSLDALKEMFAETDKRMKNLPKEYTTNPQAEVMIKGIIPSGYIKEMVFSSSEALIKFCDSHKYYCRSKSDEKLFKYRYDYEIWQKQKNEKDQSTIVPFSAIEVEELPF